MTTEDWVTNTGAFTQQAAEAAGLTAAKAAAESVAKATAAATKKATKLAVAGITTAVDATAQAVNATAENNAAAGAAATKKTEEATKAALDNAARVLASAVEAGKAAVEITASATTKATEAVTEAAENAASTFGTFGTDTNPSFEAASQKVQEQTDALTVQAKQAAAAWLDLYDQGFATFVELRTSLAKASQIDAVIDLAKTNMQALEQLNASFTSAVRDLLK